MAPILDDTIAAIASAPGGAVRGVVRVSGPATRDVLETVFQPDDDVNWSTARRATRHSGRLQIDPDRNSWLPVDVFLWPTQQSYTGESAAELHTVGSPPVLDRVLQLLLAHGVRPARPGEFTLRAFLAGRIDLVQAEAVLGIIEAEDHQELEVALRQLAGGLSGQLAQQRGELIDLLADLEAGLDFTDEDIEFVSREQLLVRLATIRERIAGLKDQAETRIESHGRQRIVLAGLPNAGKSTLLNALAGRTAALTAASAGTTRDFLEADVDFDGLALTLVDTAGWQTDEDPVQAAAARQRKDQLETAALVIWCTPADLVDPEQESRARRRVEQARPPVLAIQTRSDLSDGTGDRSDRLRLCAPRGEGLPELRQAIAEALSQPQSGQLHLVGSTAARVANSLTRTDAALQAAATADSEELVAIELHEALEHLGQILGSVYTDDVLDRVFARFCIGK